eukprot:gene5995-8254_t
MSLVNVVNVGVLDNPCSFTNPLQFEITFECIQELPDDLEWKVVYVGDAEDESKDQVLEEVMVGPVTLGMNRFILQAAAPNPDLIENDDLIGVTVILLTCSFMDNKFVQIGYYVNNEYAEPTDPENPPNPVEISKLIRNILSDQPRVTRFPIDWTGQGGPVVVADSSDFCITYGMFLLLNNELAYGHEHEHDHNSKWLVNDPTSFYESPGIGPHGILLDVRNDSEQQKWFSSFSDFNLARTDGFTDGETTDSVEHFFWGQRNGVAMELGALDGSPNTRSMTFDYEKVLGWKRILIEGDPKYRNSMIENSPLAFSVNAAICEQAAKVHFLSADYTGGIAEFMGNDFMKTYHRDIYDAATIPGNISSINWESLEGKNRKVSVIECLPLSLILKKAKVKHINWFILDVEGGEYQILQSINWASIRFDVLCIETEPSNRPPGYSERVTKYLEDKGYVNYSGQIGRNTWYIHKNFKPISRSGIAPTCYNGARKSEREDAWYSNRRTPPFTRCPIN